MVNTVDIQGSGDGPSSAAHMMTSQRREEGATRDDGGWNILNVTSYEAADLSATPLGQKETKLEVAETHSDYRIPGASSINATVLERRTAESEATATFTFVPASTAGDAFANDIINVNRTIYSTSDMLPTQNAFVYSNMTDIYGNSLVPEPATDFTTNVSAMSGVDKSGLRALGITIGLINVCLGSSGNLLTILAIIWNKKLRTTFHIFIANLCAIDFLTSATMMPFNITAYWTKSWPFGENSFTCSFMAFSYYCCGYTSIVCLLVITVNRFIGIVYPEHYDDLFTHKRIILAIAISWIFAPAFLFPIFFFASNRGYGWYPALTLCVFRTDRYNKQEQNYMQFIRVLFQFLPLVIMGVLYVKIFLTARKAGRAVLNLSRRSGDSAQGAVGRSLSNQRSRTQNSQSGRYGTCSSRVPISPSPVLHRNPFETEAKSAEDDSFELKSIDHENESSLVGLCSDREDSKSHIDSPVPPTLGSRTDYKSSTPAHQTVGGDDTKWKKEQVLANSNVRRINPDTKTKTDNKHKHRIRRQRTATEREARKRRSMDRRLLRISVTICIVFMILFLPSVIVNLIPKSVKIDPRVHMFASVITWFNSCVNPLIYCFMNAKMRKQYKLLLTKAWNSVCRCVQIDTDHAVGHGNYNSSFRSASQRSMTRHS